MDFSAESFHSLAWLFWCIEYYADYEKYCLKDSRAQDDSIHEAIVLDECIVLFFFQHVEGSKETHHDRCESPPRLFRK